MKIGEHPNRYKAAVSAQKNPCLLNRGSQLAQSRAPRILCVESSPAEQAVLSEYAETINCDLDLVISCLDATPIVSREKFDAIVLSDSPGDVHIVELVLAIRSKGCVNFDTPILVMCGSDHFKMALDTLQFDLCTATLRPLLLSTLQKAIQRNPIHERRQSEHSFPNSRNHMSGLIDKEPISDRGGSGID